MRASGNNWIKVKTVGVKSNRSGIGARDLLHDRRRTARWTRSAAAAAIISQSDFRVHFGLGKADRAEIEVRWPSGVVDRFTAPANRIVVVEEGKGQR